MKFKKLVLTAAIAVVSSVAFSAESKTPILDRETDTIKQFLWKKGMSIAPTDIYLAAMIDLQTEMCSSMKRDDDIKFHLRTAAVEAPAPVIETWFAVFKKKMREVLIANPVEAKEFCK